MQRQTKTGKTGKCLPDQQCRGRQKQENPKNVCPTRQSKGRQKQENHQNVCSINNAMADRLQIY